MRKSSIEATLQNGLEKFESLDIEKQCEVLLQIVRWLGIGFSGIDLSLIGGSPKTGTCLMGKKVTSVSELKIVFTSTAGLYERTIDLLEL